MKTSWLAGDAESFTSLPCSETQVLDPREEREVLRGLADCKRKLAEALAKIQGPDLAPGDVVVGPAVVEEFGSTVPVHPGFIATVDRFGNLLLTREDAR